MGEEPDTIRREIRETRERLSETAEALAYKADIPKRAREGVTSPVRRLRDRISGVVPDPDDVTGQARRAVGIAQENPLGLAIGSIALGFLVGLALPTTRIEEERVAPVAEQVREQARDVAAQARDVAQTAADRGREVVQETAQSAAQTARESGGQAAEEVRSTASEGAQRARESTTGGGRQGA